MAPPMVAVEFFAPSMHPDTWVWRRAENSSRSASAVGHCPAMASAQRGKPRRRRRFFRLTWSPNSLPFSFVLASSRCHPLLTGCAREGARQVGGGQEAGRTPGEQNSVPRRLSVAVRPGRWGSQGTEMSIQGCRKALIVSF
jgi:hypothetical protein